MKHLVKFLSIAACTFALISCETVEGFKRDLSDINMDKFQTASSVSNDPQSQFLTDGDCPTVQIVSDLGRLYEFAAGQTTTTDNLVSSVKMNETQSTCVFNERSVTVDLKIALDGDLGPKGRRSASEKATFSYPFFVAVTTASGKILAKEIFAASMTYPPGETEQLYFETLRQIIPADSRAQGASYKVMIGFQLAQKQLEYNRTIIAAEILATQQIELQRIEAARLRTIDDVANEASEPAEPVITRPITPQTTTLKSVEQPILINEPTPITAPQSQRAGPFDINNSDN